MMIKKCLLLLFVFASVFAFSQTEETKYPFINYAANKIVYGKDSSSMLSFYKKLGKFLNGKEKELIIVQIGGSHIQGGMWGDKLTTNFQNLRAPKGGGFFAFPFKIIKTNSPPYFTSFSNGTWKGCRTALVKNTCPNVGMAQITATTNDSANYFGMKILENSHHKNFNTIRVYHNFNKSFSFSIKGNLKSKRQEFESKGYTQFILDAPVDSIVFDLLRKDTFQRDFVLYGFDVRNTDEAGVYYAALGANGASTQSVLRCQLFAQQLKTLQPDLVILSLGVNDVQGKTFSSEDYIAHYDSLVSLIRQASPTCAILFNTITDNYVRKKTPNKKSATVEECIYKLTEKHNAALWDIYEVMGGYKSIYKWQMAGLARKDKVHFTAKGYHIFADMMFEAIMKSYYNNFKG
ncbi:MAG: GDSL-type esterase/lipase family protein [Bacteroidia bacterium]